LQNTPKIILGIDPGTSIMGYGIISVTDSKMKLVEMDVLKLSSKLDAYQKLENIYYKVSQLIVIHKPHSFAIEAPFFGKNVQSMLKLGRAQGVAIAAAMQALVPVSEYAPRKIKQSITGNGNAAKEQVLKMIQNLLNFTDEPKYIDASDAIAVAICHHFQNGKEEQGTKRKSSKWADFILANPDRII